MASLPSFSSSRQSTPVHRKGRIRQSVSRWCYQKIPLDKLCAYGAEIGLKGIDLLNSDEWEVPPRYGLVASMGYAGGGEIGSALNPPPGCKFHPRCHRAFAPCASEAPAAFQTGLEHTALCHLLRT